jgi:probable rRNA maturation factor
MIDVVVDQNVDMPCISEMIEKAVKMSCFEAKTIKNPSLCIRFANNDAVKKLNSQWRNQDKVTDVLSFPMQEGDLDEAEPLGDIILATPFVAEEAKHLGLDFDAHCYHLIAHGTLHLLGYDHIDDGEAQQMQQLENTIMAKLGLHQPYPEVDSL